MTVSEASCSKSSISFFLATILFFFFLLSVLLHFYYVPYAEDDSYIHMRIAYNLFHHGVPFYNLDESVMGSTAPLWIILITPLAALGAWMPYGVAILNGALSFLAIISWCHLARIYLSIKTFRSLLLLGIGLCGSLAVSSLSLMETPLAVLLVAISLILLYRRHSFWIVPVTLAIFVRPECVVYFICILISRIKQRKGIDGAECMYAAIGLIPLCCYQLFYFHSIIPHPAIAKGIVYQITFSEWIKFLFFAAYSERIARTVIPWIFTGLLILSLVHIYRLTSLRKKSLGQIIDYCANPTFYILTPATLILAAYAIRKVLVFPWYAPLITVPIVFMASRTVLEKSFLKRICGTLLLLPSYLIAASILYGVADPSQSPLFESGARVRRYKAIGQALYSQYPQATLLAPEIGGLGFSFMGKVFDGVGLISPRALLFHPLEVPRQRRAGFIGAVPSGFIHESHAEIIVALENFLEINARLTMLDQYREFSVPPLLPEDAILREKSSLWGNDSLKIFIRKDLPLPKEDWSMTR